MSVNLRVRSSAKGVQHLLGVDLQWTVAELRDRIAALTGIQRDNLKLLRGFPPKELSAPASDRVATLQLANGDMLTVEAAPAPSAAPPAPAPVAASGPASTAAAAAAAAASPVPAAPTATPPAAAAAASVPPTTQAAGAAASGADDETGPPVAHVGEDGFVVRRVVDADNSCLFNSIGYVLEGRSRSKARELRSLIARTVLSDPETYTDAFLGQPTADYAKWIQQPDHWGGAIELAILSEHYRVEIASVDIQTLRIDVFGQDRRYRQRVYVIYEGIHYDPLAFTFDPSLPEEMDVTVFAPDDKAAEAKAHALAAEAKKKHQFTDTAKFDLRCLVCQEGLVGAKGAQAHAKATGHTNFAEYR